ncbi:MAG: hypothetical protein AAGD40_03335 [Pseudomonadota bacterium]
MTNARLDPSTVAISVPVSDGQGALRAGRVVARTSSQGGATAVVTQQR